MMRTLLFAISVIALGATLTAQTAFINELHYDNDGGDVGELIEVAIDLSSCSGGCLSTDFSVILYNGSSSQLKPYGSTLTLGATPDGVDGPFSLFVVDPGSLQNGAPDGLALVYLNTVIEFISYEGSFTAAEGPASGMTSVDIGVSESSSTAIGESLQLVNGVWTGPLANTFGAANLAPLPVALTAFNAKVTNSGAMLEWTTASEENNDYFSVEMSRDAASFSESAQVKGNGTTESLETYSYEYRGLTAGTYYFRLRQVDYDGQSSFSDVVTLNVAGDRDFLMPSNTVTDFVIIEVTTPRPARVLNMAGAVVADFVLNAGSNNLDVSGLAQGMYILSDGINAKRFVK